MFRKIRPNNLDKINRLQSMKRHPIGAMGERDSRINKLINKLYNRKEQTWVARKRIANDGRNGERQWRKEQENRG